MDVFISWSGVRAQKVAKALRDWIPLVLQNVHPWMSDEDIEPGTRWAVELASKLDQTNFGIICLSPETLDSSWILFEAGALAKALSESSVCPYLIDLPIRDLPPPLNQFNAVAYDERGTFQLIRTINRALGDKALPENRLKITFDKWWLDLKGDLEELPEAPPQSRILSPDNLGLEYIYQDRATALDQFARHLNHEIERAANGEIGEIKIVGTSIRGFLFPSGGYFDGKEIFKRAQEQGVKLRIMLTTPELAELRADQENREDNAISNDIRSGVFQLKQLGINKKNVKYFPGAPTVFGIATSDRMLLNPYPLEWESHRSFSIIVRRTDSSKDIYRQYITHHFDNPWRHTVPVPEQDWEGRRRNQRLGGRKKSQENKRQKK